MEVAQARPQSQCSRLPFTRVFMSNGGGTFPAFTNLIYIPTMSSALPKAPSSIAELLHGPPLGPARLANAFSPRAQP